MKVIIGQTETCKSTILLHYAYNQISRLVETNQSSNGQGSTQTQANNGTQPNTGKDAQQQNAGNDQHHVCLITSKKRMNDSRMLFGTYCEVSIDTLREIRIKYIEDYESLVQYLVDFHLLKRKPSILAIDCLEAYCEQPQSIIPTMQRTHMMPPQIDSTGFANQANTPMTIDANLTHLMRLNFLLTLISDCQKHLDSSLFQSQNLIVSYRSGNNTSQGKNSSEHNNNFAMLYDEFSKYTQQIYYIIRANMDQSTHQQKSMILQNEMILLSEAQKIVAQQHMIEIFAAKENKFYLDEEINRNFSGETRSFVLEAISPDPQAMVEDSQNEDCGNKTIEDPFIIILKELRESQLFCTE